MPSLDALEGRQLLSLAIAQDVQEGDYAEVTFKSYGGQLDQANDVFNVSVGSQFGIDVKPTIEGVDIARVDYSTPHSLAGEWEMPQHDEVVNKTTRMTSATHTADGAGGTKPILSDGTDFLSGYADEHEGTDELSATVTFKTTDGSMTPPPETFYMDYDIAAPYGRLNATFPDGMYFGPLVKSMATGQAVPAPWGTNLAGGSYFGAQPNGWMRYSITGVNSTTVQGSFSTIQLVKGTMEIDAVDVDANLMPWQTPTTKTPMTWETLANQDTWISDVGPGSDTAAFSLLAQPGQRVSASAPSANEAFGDSPRVLLPNPSQTNRFAYSFTLCDDYETDIIWTPTGGTSIVVDSQPWSIRFYSENVIAAQNPSWSNSYGALSTWQFPFPNYIRKGTETDTPMLIKDTDRNATDDINLLFSQPGKGWYPGNYTVDANGNQLPANTNPVLVAQNPAPTPTPTGQPSTIMTAPGATTTTTATPPSTVTIADGTDFRSGSWADNSLYPSGVIPGLSNSTNGIPNGYWVPTPQGAPVPIPPGAIVYTAADGSEQLWYDSWGPLPTNLATPPTQVAMAPPTTVAQPAGATTPGTATDIQDPTSTTTTSSDATTTTNPGLPVPPYATNITSTATATTVDPTAPTDPADHPATGGWDWVTNNGPAHWWNFFSGEGYIEGDSLV